MNPMTRTRSYQETQDSQRFAQQQAQKKSAADSEYAHRANRSTQDDDEFRASCGLPPRHK
ncbi:MAG: hypothetical protein Q7S87_04880 [Agitococcus sp.]|nr:hypothetical protein [Agitococcus sp.]